MAYSYKTSLAFGLVYIPVTLHLAAKPKQISFNMLEKETGKRIKLRRVAEGTDREVPMDEIVKGYQYDKDSYVVFDDEDFEKVKTKKDKSVVITDFVNLSEIDPVCYEKTYYCAPAGGERAFYLLLRAMREENKVGIAKTVLGSKESVVALRADKENMLLSTLFFFEELLSPPKYKKAEISDAAKEIKLAKTLIEGMSEPFDLSKYENEYNDKLMQAIEDKIGGKQIVQAGEDLEEESVDSLMDALIASVKTADKRAGARS